MESSKKGPLFETTEGKGRGAYKLYACSVLAGLCLVWFHRASQILGERGGWVMMGAFAAELWFGFYWILSLSLRWNLVYRRTFKDRLSLRHEEGLPGVDVFVCTADHNIEPPIMVVNTVLSVMAFDYPTEKLSIYLSDDGCSELIFYALLEASRFARSWIPYSKKLKIESRSPAIYFAQASELPNGPKDDEWLMMKNLYEEMQSRINDVEKLGKVPKEIREQHKGFSEWYETITPSDRKEILKIIIDGRDLDNIDDNGCAMPSLVYVAREKNSRCHHNFKAGAMNALLRVSSVISNGAIILNVDCDMYSSNAEIVRDALCFFLDEETGHEIAYVQLPQRYNNITKNDIYGHSLTVICEMDFHGLDGYGGTLYIGSGCFHRRTSLCGATYSSQAKEHIEAGKKKSTETSASSLEDTAKTLISCTYEDNTEWGKEMGLRYGYPVEDVVTGLSIQCKGWKSVYLNPSTIGFMGVAPMTLSQTLVQQKRWSEGDFQILLSKYCPVVYGHRKIKLGLQMGYTFYFLWAPCSLPMMFYVSVLPLCLINGISLFPSVSSPWFIPFAYVIASTALYSLGESLCCGMTLKGWWNEQRIWLFKRIASYPFALIDTVLKLCGIGKSSFVVTAKVADEGVLARYKKETMDFGPPSPMLLIITTIASLNLVCLLSGMKGFVLGDAARFLGSFFFQISLCAALVLVNIPVYEGMFLRSDSGRMPTSITVASFALALLAYAVPVNK